MLKRTAEAVRTQGFCLLRRATAGSEVIADIIVVPYDVVPYEVGRFIPPKKEDAFAFQGYGVG